MSDGIDQPQDEQKVTSIWNVAMCSHCPLCGSKTEIEHREHETYVACPEHGQLLLR